MWLQEESLFEILSLLKLTLRWGSLPHFAFHFALEEILVIHFKDARSYF